MRMRRKWVNMRGAVEMNKSTFAPIPFEQYEADTRELAEQGAAVITALRCQLLESEIMMWAMVRASGGTLLVHGADIGAGYPASWRIDEDPATGGRRFTILR